MFPLLPESFLQEIRDRNDAESIISRYVRLKRGGGKLVGLCPFHNEKTASFTVFEDTQSFYCFGCGVGGDIITFIKMIENLDYMDAIRLLAEQSGLEVPDNNSSFEGTSKLREKILLMNKIAANFFHKNLNSPKGKIAKEYVNNRQLTANTITRFGIGIAFDEWDGLLKELKQNGYSQEEICSAGLAIKNEKGDCYDRFRNRLIFPIIDVRGNVIAFGGRVLDNSMPKYLNSPDTLVFKKSLNLFALNFAKSSASGRLILAEGYMDVISMHQAGFTEAVATLGTAITQQQARLISRYTKNVIIAYDADSAGQKATGKAIELLSSLGVIVKVLKITGGKDPDEYIKTFGVEKFKTLISGSGNHIEYRINDLRAKYNLEDAQDTISFLRQAAEVFVSVRNAIEREVYINKIASETNISKEKFEIEVNKRIKEKGKKLFLDDFKAKNAMLTGIRDTVNPQKAKNLLGAKAEEKLISLFMQNPDFYQFITERISEDDFVTDFNKRVFVYIRDRIEQNLSLDFIMLSKDFSNDEMSKIIGFCANGKLTHMNTKEETDDYINTIKKAKNKSTLKDIKDMSMEDWSNSFKNKSK